MSLQFVLGASGSGKSQSAYEWMIQEAIAHPKTQYILLVPDQYTMQLQKQIVAMHPGHAIFNIDILSFSRLYHKIMEELGGDSRVPLDDTGKNLILRKIAGNMKDELPVLGSLLERQGYISEVKGIISEMQQYGISPEGMDTLISGSTSRRGLQARLEDVQKLYKAYFDYQKEDYRTSESMYPILAKRLKESSFLKNAIVFMDGFTGFTPVQMPLVEEIILCAKDTYVAMTIDTEPNEVTEEQQLFYTIAKTIRDLERFALRAGVIIAPYIWCKKTPRFDKNEALAHFEKNLFRPNFQKFEKQTDAISIRQATKPRQESFFLAKEIKRLLREDGYQQRDIAVICGSMDTYRHHLEEAFSQMEISYFIDANSPMLHNPLMEVLQGLLDILGQDFSFAGIMRYLHSGFSNLTKEEADLLELYFIETGIRGKYAFSRPFTRKAKDFPLEKINLLRESLMQELEPCLFSGKHSTQYYIEHVYRLLTALSVEQKLEGYAEYFTALGEVGKARAYGQIYRKVMDLFNQMVVLMGEELLSVEQFGEILRAGFEELRVGFIPAKVDQVIVGDIERTRLNQIKVLFVVGVNDANIPGSNAKGGMISDMEREYLASTGVELAPTKRQLQFRQRFYLYQQTTKPSEKLYLSYSNVDNTEKELRPSYLIHTVCQMFPSLIVQEPSVELLAEHKSELLSQFVELSNAYMTDRLTEEATVKFYTMLVALEKCLDKDLLDRLLLELSTYATSTRPQLNVEIAKSLYGTVLYGSVSRLEQFATCPYAHFLKYGLGLREPREYVLESADLGTIFHDVLYGFSTDLKKDGYTWQNFPTYYGERKISEKIAIMKETYGDELLLDKARNGFALSRAERILKRSVTVLQKHMQSGEFEPYGEELDFDISCEWNASKELLLRLKGRIDRIDTVTKDDDVYVKIIDYKSGNKQLELDCVYEGLQMQLVAYMDSAMKLLKERLPDKQIHPAAMFYYRVADPVVDMGGSENFDGLSQKLLMEQRTRGIVNSAPEVLKMLDKDMVNESNIIPVKQRKDETVDGAYSEEEFAVLCEYTQKKMAQMAADIMNGKIEKAPFVRGEKEHGCQYCPYFGACNFEPQYYKGREVEKLSDEDALQQMQEFCERS